MRSYTLSELVSKSKQLGYTFPSFNLIGIRSRLDIPDSFDDKFYLVDTKKSRFIETSCTTNPGVYWLQNFMNPKGTAVLPPGQYLQSFKLGKHKGVYEALVQARPFTVWRDKDKDNKAESSLNTDTGMFGINIHRANESMVSKIVGKYSAGCQVINDPVAFNRIIQECKLSGQTVFDYTLFSEW